MHMANEQYQQSSHKWKTWQLGFQTLERYWASFQVTTLFHSATIFFQPGRLLEWRVFNYYFFMYLFIFIYLFIYLFFIFLGGAVLSSNAFTIWCCIPISRPPRVIRRFKRRSCFQVQVNSDMIRHAFIGLHPISIQSLIWRLIYDMQIENIEDVVSQLFKLMQVSNCLPVMPTWLYVTSIYETYSHSESTVHEMNDILWYICIRSSHQISQRLVHRCLFGQVTIGDDAPTA